MNTPNTSNTQTNLSRVLEKITEIANASAQGDFIYRGEPKCHDEVSSNLYREYKDDIEAERFNIEVVQNEILKEAQEYATHKMDDLEILTELQHHGGKTNLIDFTTDYLVALFFACNKKPNKSGRVILLQRQSETYKVVKPPKTITRAGVQKSIFVQAPSGVVPPDTVVCIPADLKGDMLDYLRKSHDISTKTIYNDLQGFIENRSSHKSAYTEFYKGVTCQDQGDSTRDPADKRKWYDKAIEHYTEAVTLNPELAETYNNRGNVYYSKGEFDRAIQDYNRTIDLNPGLAQAYNNRGNAYHKEGKFDIAIGDFNTAIILNPELADAYSNRGNVYYSKGELDTAIGDFNTAIILNPELADAYSNRGNVYYSKGEFDTAIGDFNTAIILNPELASAYNNRGAAYYSKGEFDPAIQDYNTTTELNPEFADAYSNRGEVWLHLREWEKAKADLITAKNKGVDLVASFHNDYESIEDFEAKCGVKIPENIAALLRQD